MISALDMVRGYLEIESEDLFTNYYTHSPLSKEYFEILWDKFLILIEKVAFNNLNLSIVTDF